MGYSGARGTLIYEKNLKAKISCQTPFNLFITLAGAVLLHVWLYVASLRLPSLTKGPWEQGEQGKRLALEIGSYKFFL